MLEIVVMMGGGEKHSVVCVCVSVWQREWERAAAEYCSVGELQQGFGVLH